ncbi:MAG TPA: type II secretion system protein GspG [Rhodanobacteraceae bacterium]|nr:type II secretion system protein GspG [Rhodanobacteraceae bacterium]
MSPMILSGTGDRGPGTNSPDIRPSDQAPGSGGAETYPAAGKRARRRSRVPGPRSLGFTLLEMLAVIVLLGIVAVIVARSVSGRVDTGKWKAGTIGVTKLDQDVQAYALDNGSPPKSLDDLIAKPLNAPSWNGPYAKPADLKDPFGHPYGYVYPGKHGQYDIVFWGRDGKPNGEGVDRDYGNWQ